MRGARQKTGQKREGKEFLAPFNLFFVGGLPPPPFPLLLLFLDLHAGEEGKGGIFLTSSPSFSRKMTGGEKREKEEKAADKCGSVFACGLDIIKEHNRPPPGWLGTCAKEENSKELPHSTFA